jgi:hypothetical protein
MLLFFRFGNTKGFGGSVTIGLFRLGRITDRIMFKLTKLFQSLVVSQMRFSFCRRILTREVLKLNAVYTTSSTSTSSTSGASSTSSTNAGCPGPCLDLILIDTWAFYVL